MTRAIVSQSAHKRRFGAGLAVAAGIHLAAISFATVQRVQPLTASGTPADGPEVILEPAEPNVDPQRGPPQPLPTLPEIDPFYVEQKATPPPVHRTPTRFPSLVRPRTNTS